MCGDTVSGNASALKRLRMELEETNDESEHETAESNAVVPNAVALQDTAAPSGGGLKSDSAEKGGDNEFEARLRGKCIMV